MKRAIKIFLVAFFIFIINICIISAYYTFNLSDRYYITKGENLNLSTVFSITASAQNKISSAAHTASESKNIRLKLFGILPLKTVELNTVETAELIPSGEPFGIKLLMEGVMIVDTSEIKTDSGTVCPADECGLEKGDIILTADGKEIDSNSDIAEIVSNSSGKKITITYTRNETEESTVLTPALSKDGEYKAGIWVRDSTAGIGTITYREADTDRFGALGHPVCDGDTGEIIPIHSGETADVTVTQVIKGTMGTPGELHGCFSSELSSGIIYNNNECGVFGEMFEKADKSKALPVAFKQEIKEGKATILSTLDETGPKEYEISIEKISHNSENTKNMVIRVTDEDLLKKTGGIVQGMSGSPIIQDGKIIGAVTHVLVNDPTTGYGIFIENMMKAS